MEQPSAESVKRPARANPMLALELRLSPRREVAGVRVAVTFASSRSERAAQFEKVRAALLLIREYAPVRFAQLRRDVATVFVTSLAGYYGQYDPALRLAELSFDWMLLDGTSPLHAASTLIHEAQHGRLYQLGFGYREGERWAIERLCTRAQKNFVQRVPGGEPLRRRYEERLASGAEEHFATRRLVHSEIDALSETCAPRWMVNGLRKMAERRFPATDGE